MPEVNTRHFGAISFEEDALLLFPQGLPAFEHARRFVLIGGAAASPFVFLQSVEIPELSFAAVPVLHVDPQHEMGVCREDLVLLGLDDRRQPLIGEEVQCLAIVSERADGVVTANLLAPVVINLESRVATQAIRTDQKYSHQCVIAGDETGCS